MFCYFRVCVLKCLLLCGLGEIGFGLHKLEFCDFVCVWEFLWFGRIFEFADLAFNFVFDCSDWV